MVYEDYLGLIPTNHVVSRTAGEHWQDYMDYMRFTDDREEYSRFAQFVTVCVKQAIELGNMMENYENDFDVSQAVGKQLDFVGAIVGATRKLDYVVEDSSGMLGDDDFRLLIRSRIAQNMWDGTNESLVTIMRDVFSSYGVSFKDNQNMTMTYEVRGGFTNIQRQMIAGDLIFPRPAGVGSSCTIIDTSASTAVDVSTTIGSDFERATMKGAVSD